jgi:hypothetical protein
VIFGPSTENKIALAVVAGVFIVFALLSAFVFPRRWPDFPGKRGRGVYILASVVLFVAAIVAVELFAVEEEEEAGETPATETQGTEPGGTETGGETGTGATETGGGGATEGDPKAGEQIFAANGCGGCHTLAAANGSGAMPSFKDDLSEQDIQNVAAYVVASTSGG